MGLYDVDGRIALTASPGSGWVGLYAPDGSWYYTVSPGSGFVGMYAPDGSLYITNATGSSEIGLFAADGSIRVTSANENNGALKVSGLYLSSTLTSGALPSWLSHSRAGGAMMFDSTGKLTWAPENYCLYNNDFTGPVWFKNNITVGVGGLLYPSTSSYLPYVQQIMSDNLTKSISSFEAKSSGLDWVYIFKGDGSLVAAWINVSTGVVGTIAPGFTVGIEPSTDGYYKIWIKHPDVMNSLYIGMSDADNTLSVTANGTDGVLFRNIQVERVTYETTPRAYNPTTSVVYHGPRFDYNPNTLTALGLLLEGTRTNAVLWNRDLTNVAWTATNVTPLKDQTGIDGVANSASKITATAANGTILQAITLASSARFQTAYVKRITGSGVIEMTMDNGTTWTPITVTADWTRVSIPTQTLANPTVGFRIVTSGDAIAVDFVANENGTFASSYIWTTTAAVTRASDSIADALYSTNPTIIQYRSVETGVRARKKLAELDDISAEQNIWLEEVAVYPIGTTDAYLDAHLTVDGSY